MSNRFAQLGSEGAAGSAKNKKKEERAKLLAAGDAVPLLNQRIVPEGTKLRGFQEVEAKPNVRPKGKPRAKQAEVATSDAAVFATVLAKPKPAPKRKGPIGGDVITEEQLKAEKKALQQQKKAVASQRVKVAVGDAVTEKTKAANDAKLRELEEQLVAAPAAGAAGGKKPVRAVQAAAAKHTVKATVADDLPEDREDLPKRKPAPKPKAAVYIDPTAPAAAGGPKPRPKGKSAAAASGAAAHFAAAERQSATNHEHLADGSVVALTKFCFASGTKSQALVGGRGLDEVTNFVLQAVKNTGTVKGGFFIVVEGKHFSDETTIDEPWMTESIFKALLQLLRDNKPEAIAYPFWPVSNAAGKKGAVDTVEAQVKLRIVGGTALELEHVDHGYSLHVSIKKCKVSLRHFVRDVVQNGALLVQLKAKIAESAADAALKDKALAILGAKIETLVDEVSAAAGSLLAE